MIGDDARHHGFADRHGADADAGIMSPFGYDLALATITVHGAARSQYRRGRLDHEPGDDRLPGGDAAQDPAGVVRQETRLAVVAHADFVGVLLAAERRDRETVADLD